MNNAEPHTLDQWLAFAQNSHPRDIEMGLQRVREVAARMGLLDARAVKYIIVAGTNGKGSTTTAIAALLQQAGLKTGATLSPHVHRFNERVQIDGRDLDDDSLCAAFASVDEARGEIPLTYFEFSTLVALESFRQAAVEVAVLEVGLGGRLDAFNIISADVAVVTSIGLDHQDFLGDDLEQIGREKAGVFRTGQQVILGHVSNSVHAAASDLNCRTRALGTDFQIEEQAQCWSFHSRDQSFQELPRGVLAPTNLALAIAAASCLVDLETPQIEAAIEAAQLPGRMEQWRCQEHTVLLDVAHNPAGAEFLAAQLELRYQGMEFIGVLGMLEGKMPVQVVAALPMVRKWLLVPTIGFRRRSAAELQHALSDSVHSEVFEDFSEAMNSALSSVPAGNGILVAGSFSVVEQARNWLLKSPHCAALRATPP